MTIEESKKFITKKEKEFNDKNILLQNELKLSNEIEQELKKGKKELSFKDKNKLKTKLNNLNKEIKILKKDKNRLKKELINENKNLERKLKPKKELDFIWKISSFIFGIGFILLLIIILVFKDSQMIWMVTSFLLLIMFLGVFIFLIFLGKKTHAVLEFKSFLSGKPMCLFFTDHKRVDWKVIEPEAGIIYDKKYGAFLINQKGSYIDEKTKNILIPFNPSVATNAPLEAFKMTDGLAKVFNDEKKLSEIRYTLANSEFSGDEVIIEGGEILKPFQMLRESVDFSHLKSLMNTILPHNINSKIEMQVAQRTNGLGKINTAQIILIVVAIIGATVLASILLKTVGGGGSGGTTTIIKEVAKTAVQNSTTTIGG